LKSISNTRDAIIFPTRTYQATKFDLIFNLGSAKSLGLELSARLLSRADEVIE